MNIEKANESLGRSEGGQYAERITQLRAETIRHSRHAAWLLGAAFLASAAIGLAIWFWEPARDRDNVHFGFAGGAGLMVFFLICLGSRLFSQKPKAICPRCGCDWNAESDNNTQLWMDWRCCPGCGLDICGETESPETALIDHGA